MRFFQSCCLEEVLKISCVGNLIESVNTLLRAHIDTYKMTNEDKLLGLLLYGGNYGSVVYLQSF